MIIQIPVTKRGVNESFWVITGTTSSLEMSGDIALAAKSSATVVILMGMRHLSKIVELFSEARGENEAIAVIQNGSKENERSAICELHEIENQVEEQGLGSPAIIVIGEVARLGKRKIVEAYSASISVQEV